MASHMAGEQKQPHNKGGVSPGASPGGAAPAHAMRKLRAAKTRISLTGFFPAGAHQDEKEDIDGVLAPHEDIANAGSRTAPCQVGDNNAGDEVDEEGR